LAFGLSWAAWPLTLLNPESSPLVPFGPAIAAIVVAALTGGRRNVLQLLRRLGHWRVRPMWYLIALGSPLLMMALAAAAAVAAGSPAPDADLYASLAAIPMTLISTIVIVGLFEELGWRGYALPNLQRAHGALWSALVLGGAWAIWHLPELISDPTGQRPPVPFMISILAQSVILTWLYNSTSGSLPVVILFHAAVNTAGQYVLPEFVGDYYLTAWWALTAIHIIAAVAVIRFAGAKRLTTRMRDSLETAAVERLRWS
jgi:uncharacterized protein